MLERDVIKKANEIIDITKNNQEKYHDERNLIFNLLKRSNDKEIIEILESVIRIFEKNKKIEYEIERYKNLELENLEKNIRSQKIRQEDGTVGKIVLFVIEDDEKEQYSFFTRENAQNYIDIHKEKFNKNTTIKIIKNENVDIENLILKMLNKKR